MTAGLMVLSNIQLPEFDATFASKAEQLLSNVQDYTIDSAEVRAMADKDLADAKLLLKRVEETRKEQKAPYAEAAKAVDSYYDTAKTLLNEAISGITPKILAYDRKLAEERAAVQRASEEAARAEKERLLKEAEAAARAGNKDTADALEMASTMVQAPVIATRVDKAEQSTSSRENWSAEVVDLMELVKAVAAGKVSINAIEPSATWLNGQARLEKAKLAIPGVQAIMRESLSRRAA